MIKHADGHYAVTILRPTALFGEYHKGSIYELVKSINKRRFVIFGSGKNLTNFYYIRDFVEILIKVIDNNKAFNQVFIASDTPFQLNILISWILVSLKSRKLILKVPVWMGFIASYILDILTCLTKNTFPLSIRRLKAMTHDVTYSNNKIIYSLNVKAKYGIQQGIILSGP